MFAPDDRSDPQQPDPHAGAGDGIAEDRRARILRQFVYSGAALAVAGVIAVTNGCDREPASEEPIVETDRTAVIPPTDETHLNAPLAVLPSMVPLKAPFDDFALHPTDGQAEFTPTETGVRLNGRGYFASTAEYGPDFTVVYEYRFPNAAELPEAERPTCNTGCLLFVGPEDAVWPRCLEVQGKWTETAQIKSNARDVTVESSTDESARDAARQPPGEWNRVEIASVGGALTVMLNGVEVSTSESTELTQGRIGFQAEGFPVEFRDVTIRE